MGINNMSWFTAFSRLMAVLLTAEATSKDEAAGLAAHQHVIAASQRLGKQSLVEM